MATKKTHTVLFVDDEQSLLDGVRNTLRKEPYEVVTAVSASEGLRILHEQRVDVIVSDERMPGVTGSDFLAYVRQRHKDTVRIMLTGQASLEAAIQAINEGEVYRFLTKPCSPKLLAHTLRDAIMFLDLTRESRLLLMEVRRQRAVLQELERQHPGITAVERSADGSIVFADSADTAELVREMRKEAARARDDAA